MVAIKHVQHCVFIRTDRLGETLLTLPALTALKGVFPHATLTLLVQPDLGSLLVGALGIDRVITYQTDPRSEWWSRALQVAKLLRGHRFDLAIIANPKKEFHVAVWVAGIPYRIGYNRKWGWLLTHRVADCKALGERHEVEYNLDLARALGVSVPVPSDWHFPPLLSEQQQVLQLLEEQGIRTSMPFIAVHPWTSNPIKQWPIERFQMLVERLVKQRGCQMAIVGGPEEQARAADVSWPSHGVANLVGRLTLRQLAALFQRAQLLVSNDSGPVHLAAAVKTKTVVLFGTSNPANGPRRWGPWGDGHAVIWKASMEAITVQEVFEAVRQSTA